MDEAQQLIYDTLIRHKDYFQLDNIFFTPWRWAVQTIIELLIWAVEGIQTVILEVLDLRILLENAEVIKFMNTFNGVAYGIGVLSLTFYAIRRMVDKKGDGYALMENLALGAGVMALSASLVIQIMTTSVNIAKELYTGTSQDQSYLYSVINQNTYDLYKLLDNDFDPEKGHTHLNKGNLTFFDYAETITKIDQTNRVVDHSEDEEYDAIRNNQEWAAISGGLSIDISSTIAELEAAKGNVPPTLFEYTVTMGLNNDLLLIPIQQVSWLHIPRHYYRYKMNSFAVIAYLATLFLVYAISSIKFVKLLFEIVYSQTILPLYAFSDLTRAQKLLKIIENIKNAAISIVFGGLVLGSYTAIQLALAETDMSGFTSAIVQFGLALAAVDGPNIAQTLTGVDAGLRSMTQGMLGTLIASTQAAQGVGNLVDRAKGGASSIKEGIGKMAEKGKGMWNDWKAFSGQGGAGGSSSTSGGGSAKANERDQYVQNELKKQGMSEQSGSNASPTSGSQTDSASAESSHSSTSTDSATHRDNMTARDHAERVAEAFKESGSHSSSSSVSSTPGSSAASSADVSSPRSQRPHSPRDEANPGGATQPKADKLPDLDELQSK
ncbi:MAG: hypothetical protein Q4B80_01790 [Aerococcaceae bacterium]|nr:hypothetical protein [Aerococcaceae bacterium]